MGFQDNKKGSVIWNLAANNKNLISNHSFWEIRGGDKANFWEEAWQQREKLNSKPQLEEMLQYTNIHREKTVKNFW